jgi:hypothetical protein
VNPSAISPRNLEKVYRKIRSDVIQAERVRTLSAKSAALAVFWEQTDGKTVAERRTEWDGLHPEWSYPDAGGNFGRDARGAHRNVVGDEGME